MSPKQCTTKLIQQMSAAPKQCHYFTLWIKLSSKCIKTHIVLTDNCTKTRRRYPELFDSTSDWRLPRPQYRKNTMWESKEVLEMTTARPNTSWKTATPLTHSCNNDGVIQLGPLSSDSNEMWGRRNQWYVFCTPSLVAVATEFKSGEFEGHSSGKSKHFDDVNLGHHYFVLCKKW